MQKHWYLGFLGLIGIYLLPSLYSAIAADGNLWELSNILWFLWFFHFVPVEQHGGEH